MENLTKQGATEITEQEVIFSRDKAKRKYGQAGPTYVFVTAVRKTRCNAKKGRVSQIYPRRSQEKLEQNKALLTHL